MAQVGAVACSFVWKRALVPLSERVEQWHTDGFDGMGSMLLGKGDSLFLFEAVLFGTVVAVNTWANNIAALTGTVLTIIDNEDTSFLNMQFVRPEFTSSAARQPGTSVATRGRIMLRGFVVA